jgi:hypothetical protein
MESVKSVVVFSQERSLGNWRYVSVTIRIIPANIPNGKIWEVQRFDRWEGDRCGQVQLSGRHQLKWEKFLDFRRERIDGEGNHALYD